MDLNKPSEMKFYSTNIKEPFEINNNKFQS